MGGTIGCAECHDHKFDPFLTKDFYQMESFFADLSEKGFYADGFSKNDWGPKIELPDDNQSKRLKELDQQIAAVTRNISAITNNALSRSRRFWESNVLALDKAGLLGWTNQRPLSVFSSGGTTLTLQTNFSVLASGRIPDHDDYTVVIPANLKRITGIALDVLKDQSLAGNELGRAGETFTLGEIEVAVGRGLGGRARPIKLVSASADFSQEGFPILAAIDGNLDTGWAQGGSSPKDRRAAFMFAQPIKGGSNVTLTVRLKHSPKHPREQIGKFRLALTSMDHATFEKQGLPEDVLKALRVPVTKRTNSQEKVIAKYYRTIAPEVAPLNQQLAALQAERSLIVGKVPTTLVSQATKPRAIRVLPRGDWMNDSGETVQPGAPHFLTPMEVGTNRATRLDLANWFVSKGNPLTARVFVNRLWKMYFGAGISRTLDDLGSQGDWPSHLELLDWLSAEFMESGWDVKHLVELIVSSRTYRQSSISNRVLEERDPLNRLWARQSGWRLDAEMVRDNALAISGLLVDKQGGPSVRPYQPEGYYAPLNFPKREYVPDEGDGLHRRGLYTHWQRTFLHPSLLAFDAPSREECTANRINSNTPLQALVLLNDTTYVEAARVFAENIIRRGGRDFAARLQWSYQQALSRSPLPEEIRLLEKLYQRELKYFREHPEAAREVVSTGAAPAARKLKQAEVSAWTAVARALFNLNETITRS